MMPRKFDLITGMTIAVVGLALLLGYSLGRSARPTDADALAAKQAAYAAGVKRGAAGAKSDGYNSGFAAGAIKGTRLGRQRGQAAATGTGSTGTTGSTGSTSSTSSTGATGR